MSNLLEKARQHEEIKRLKLEKLKRLEAQQKLQAMLPHLYMHKRYPWQREFEDEVHMRYQVITAANQIGKSSSAIQKLIRLATEPHRWKEIWPNLVDPDNAVLQFWYLYPSYDVATAEFENKWRPLLPRVPEDDPDYGWKPEYARKHIKALYFPRVNLYFKSYSQDVEDLQSGSVHVLGADEELPVHLLPELQMRTNATDGIMMFVFTATKGQTFWRQVVEDRTVWKDVARIWQVPLHACMKYADGTPSQWTAQRIASAIAKCKDQNEVDRRIFGKFVVDEGRRFPTFSRERHMAPYKKIPVDWPVFVGIDHGAGGGKLNHPAAITFLACEPSYKMAYVIRHWRGDTEVTTSRDTVDWYVRMAQTVKNPIIAIYYDYHAKDVGLFAQKAGLPFQNAEKHHDIGEGCLNALFQNDAVQIFTQSDVSDEENIPGYFLEGYKLAEEFDSLQNNIDKRQAKDDSIDSMRYSAAKIPFDFENLMSMDRLKQILSKPHRMKTVDEQRRDAMIEGEEPDGSSVDEELEFWGSQYDD